MPEVSICIPAFELGGRGVTMLTTLFQSVAMQTMQDFEVVISDHSMNDKIFKLCEEWRHKFPLFYISNSRSRGSCEANLNNAILSSRGKFIKPLLQDDFFLSPRALEKLLGAITADNKWSAGGCLHCKEDEVDKLFHPHLPQWVPDRSLALGQNRIGSPSVVLYPREIKNYLFDENLLLFMDCELYYRLGLEIGPPSCVSDYLHVIRMRHDSISDTEVTDDVRGEEFNYVLNKMDNTGRPLSDFKLINERAQKLGLDQNAGLPQYQ